MICPLPFTDKATALWRWKESFRPRVLAKSIERSDRSFVTLDPAVKQRFLDQAGRPGFVFVHLWSIHSFVDLGGFALPSRTKPAIKAMSFSFPVPPTYVYVIDNANEDLFCFRVSSVWVMVHTLARRIAMRLPLCNAERLNGFLSYAANE